MAAQDHADSDNESFKSANDGDVAGGEHSVPQQHFTPDEEAVGTRSPAHATPTRILTTAGHVEAVE